MKEQPTNEMMKPYRERVIAEKKELDERAAKLSTKVQNDLMWQLSEVLGQRITKFLRRNIQRNHRRPRNIIMSDLINEYQKSGLVSDNPTSYFRRCNSCDGRFHPDDLYEVGVEEYGQHNTLEICDDCMTKPNASKLSMEAFDFISANA